MSNNELYHYGILGMKWGKHKSGESSTASKTPLTDEELSAKVKRLTLESTYNKLAKSNTKMLKTERAKKVVDESYKVIDAIKTINRSNSKPKRQKMDLSKMTDKELRDRINRENLEKQYNDMFASPEAVSKGKKYVSQILEATGGILVTTSSALGIALAIKQLRE